MREISWLAENMLDSQEEPCSMVLVSHLIYIHKCWVKYFMNSWLFNDINIQIKKTFLHILKKLFMFQTYLEIAQIITLNIYSFCLKHFQISVNLTR